MQHRCTACSRICPHSHIQQEGLLCLRGSLTCTQSAKACPPSYSPSVALDRTLYISLDMPPDLETNPTEPGLCSLHAMMFSKVPAVSPILKAPAWTSAKEGWEATACNQVHLQHLIVDAVLPAPLDAAIACHLGVTVGHEGQQQQLICRVANKHDRFGV